MSRFRLSVLAVSVGALFLAGCAFSSSYYLQGEGKDRHILERMFADVKAAVNSPERRFVSMQEIVKILRATGRTGRLNLFLTDYVEHHKSDPFDAYYLYVVAQDYVRSGADPFAVHYLNRILGGYPDLVVRGSSIDYLSLKELVTLSTSPYQRVADYKELLARFSPQIEKGPTYYYLARSYGQLGEWSKEMQAYANYLQQPDGTIPGVPNARSQVATMVDLYNYPKVDWAFSNLDDLVNAIRYAIQVGSVSLLSRYWAKVGFFARSWESQDGPVDPLFLGDFNHFMNPSVYVAPQFDVASNSQEAYLETIGWSYRIPTWYLYFKKIDFPEDPSIQSKWEWAGIYFGNKPFSNQGF